jgi:putative two-component system response regulator
LLALADVYDALRRRRQHKPALPHSEAVKILLEASPGQFDPYVVQAFAARQHDFERIFREVHT